MSYISENNYEQKYLKYKQKYLILKNQIGSGQKFMKAVKEGNLKVVEEKLEYEHGWNDKVADPNQIEKSTRKRAIQYAIELNNLELFKLLIKYKANLKDEDIELILKQLNKKEFIITLLEYRYSFTDNQIKLIETIYSNFKNLIILYVKKYNIVNKRGNITDSINKLYNIINTGYWSKESGGMIMPASTVVTAMAYNNLRNNKKYLTREEKIEYMARIDQLNKQLLDLEKEYTDIESLINIELNKLN
jgi:hypothetical protein